MKQIMRLLFCLIVLCLSVLAQPPQLTCPTDRAHASGGWPQGRTVWYNLESISGLGTAEKDRIRQFFQKWSQWTSSNGVHNYGFAECGGLMALPTVVAPSIESR